MRIKKLQTGGIAPFSVYKPTPATAAVDQTTAAPAAAETEAAAPADLLDEKMIKLLMENGIPSDVNSFLSEVGQLQTMIANGAPIDSTSIMYQKILPKINQIKFSNDELKNVTDTLVSNGGISEAAITDTGLIMAQDENGAIKPISVTEYKENLDKYRVITNNELRHIRAQDPSAAFKSGYISVMANGKGMGVVTKELQDVFSKIESTKEKNESMLTDAERLAILQADKLSNMSDADKMKFLDSLSGTMTTATTENKNSIKQAQKAFNYLYQTLPQNSKTLIDLKAAQSGTTRDAIMVSLLESMMGSETSFSFDIKKNPVGDGSGSGSGSSGGVTQLTLEQMVAGNAINGGGMKTAAYNNGSNWTINLPYMKVPLLDQKGEGIPANTSLNNVLNEAFPRIADKGSAWLGDKKLSSDDMSLMLATGEDQGKVYLPIDLEEYNKTGNIKPATYKVLDAISKIEAQVKKERLTENERYQLYADEDLEMYLTNNIEGSQFYAPFLGIQVIGQVGNIRDDKSSKALKTFEPSNQDILKLRVNEGISGIKGGGKEDYNFSRWRPFKNDWAKGMVYVLLDDNNINASIGNTYVNKNDLNYDQMIINENKDRQRVAENNAVTGSNWFDNSYGE